MTVSSCVDSGTAWFRITIYSSQAIANNNAVINLLETRYQDDVVDHGRLTPELINFEDFDQRLEKFTRLGGNTASGEMGGWRHWAIGNIER